MRSEGARRPPRPRAGFTTLELLVAAAAGLGVTAAGLALLASGNALVARSLAGREAWRQTEAAAGLWATEWRGAGYDPGGAAGAGVGRLARDTMEFTADWNGNGALEPTDSNPNERLAWAAASGAWKRGVNGGGRIAVATPGAVAFAFRDASGEDLGAAPAASEAVVAEARVELGGAAGGRVRVRWAAARRNREAP